MIKFISERFQRGDALCALLKTKIEMEREIHVVGEWGAHEMVGKDWANVSGRISIFIKKN